MATTESKGAVIAAIVANACIAVLKFLAAAVTGSSAMVAEAIHSLVDTGDGALIWIGLKRSQKGPDAQHPFGHGKELYFWIIVVAVMIFAVGGGMSVYEGITHLMHPEPMRDPRWNYFVLAAAFVFEGASWAFAFRSFRAEQKDRGFWETVNTSKDPSSFAILFEDTAALTGLVAAAAGVLLSQWLNSPVPDALASMVVGGILMAVAWLLARAAHRLIIGESAEPGLVDAVRASAEADPAVTKVQRVITVHFGPASVLANLQVSFRTDIAAEEIPRAIDRIQRRICGTVRRVRYVFIEAESVTQPTPA